LPVREEPAAPVAAVPVDPLAGLEQALDGAMGSGHADLFHAIEALLVRRAFVRCRDNQVQTARLLGITRNTLRTLLKRYGLLGEVGSDAGGEVIAENEAEPDYSLAD
jgi:sigma-54-specific transcriptional regulator